MKSQESMMVLNVLPCTHNISFTSFHILKQTRIENF